MQADLDRFNSRRSTVLSTEGMVATSQPLAAQAGLEILKAGGNAFDAAVATAAALNVVEPTSTGIGGDVFACYRTADGELGALNASGPSGQRATLERVREQVGGDEPEMPLRGGLTVTVPGAARGWEWTLENHGTLGFDEVLEPAIRYATTGYPVSEIIASNWQSGDELFQTPHARAAYLTDDRPPHAGELMTLDRLGASLEVVADEGADAIYEGHLGEAIVEEVQREGGLLELDDLSDFEPERVEPVSSSFRDATVYELPPNTQGMIVLEALSIAEAAGLDPGSFGTAEYDHRLIEATKLAFHDGHRHLTDPRFDPPPALLDDKHITERASRIEDDSVLEAELLESIAEEADTVLLCTADAEGNLVTYINSRFAGFGSGLVAGDTGIALQNRGASFSLDPDHANRMAPGKRPFHTLIPAMAELGDGSWLSFGVMGGFMQPQGHIQVITNLIDGQMTLQAALDAPRWRHYADGTLGIEARYGEHIVSRLARRGHDLGIRLPVHFGGAQAISQRDGIIAGATEPRKDGAAVGY